MKNIILSVVLLFLCNCESFAQVADNVIYAEWATSIFSNGFSLNYERSISRHYAVRVGYGIGSSLPEPFDNVRTSGEGPMLMVLYYTEGNKKFEFGLGASFVYTKRDDNGNRDRSFYPAIMFGYRYQPSEGGLLLRIGLTYDYYFGTPLELSLGYAF